MQAIRSISSDLQDENVPNKNPNSILDNIQKIHDPIPLKHVFLKVRVSMNIIFV